MSTQVLVELGADISAPGGPHATPLIQACRSLDPGMARALLSTKRPVDVEAQDAQGHTARTTAVHAMIDASLSSRSTATAPSGGAAGPNSREAPAPGSGDTSAADGSQEDASVGGGGAPGAAAYEIFTMLVHRGADVNRPLPARVAQLLATQSGLLAGAGSAATALSMSQVRALRRGLCVGAGVRMGTNTSVVHAVAFSRCLQCAGPEQHEHAELHGRPAASLWIGRPLHRRVAGRAGVRALSGLHGVGQVQERHGGRGGQP